MYVADILFESVEDAKSFVNICNSAPFSVELVAGAYVIDAKSIMGIFSLDLSKRIEMHADCAETDPFVEKVKPFVK